MFKVKYLKIKRNGVAFGKHEGWGLVARENNNVIGGLDLSVLLTDLRGGERAQA